LIVAVVAETWGKRYPFDPPSALMLLIFSLYGEGEAWVRVRTYPWEAQSSLSSKLGNTGARLTDSMRHMRQHVFYILGLQEGFTPVRVGVLYSGGKDSNLALLRASREHSVACLIALKPRSVESVLFHYPNVELVELQAEALGLPLVLEESFDDEEGSLAALRRALSRALEHHGIEGVVTGAVKSKYQADRFRAVAESLGLSCLNPLWGLDEVELLREVLASRIVAIFTRVAGYPLSRSLLGRTLDEEAVELLARLRSYVNPSGEGGEYETFVLDSPMFRMKIVPLEWRVVGSDYDATLLIEKAVLVEKQR